MFFSSNKLDRNEYLVFSGGPTLPASNGTVINAGHLFDQDLICLVLFKRGVQNPSSALKPLSGRIFYAPPALWIPLTAILNIYIFETD